MQMKPKIIAIDDNRVILKLTLIRVTWHFRTSRISHCLPQLLNKGITGMQELGYNISMSLVVLASENAFLANELEDRT
jgi:hypothetical protein